MPLHLTAFVFGQLRRLVENRAADVELADVEAAGQLAGPLSAEAGWSQDQGAVGVSPHQQLLDYEAGLDGFAETDPVGEQQPGRLTTKDGKRRLQLVGEQVDPGRRGGLEGIARRVVTGQCTERPVPGRAPHDAEVGGSVKTDRSIEGKEQASTKAPVGSIDAIQMGRFAVDVRRQPGDAPAVSSSTHQIPGLKP